MSFALSMKAAAIPKAAEQRQQAAHEEVPSAGEQRPADYHTQEKRGDAVVEGNSQAE
jgi:hypothetical protein